MTAGSIRAGLAAALCTAAALASSPTRTPAQEFSVDMVGSRGDRDELRTAFGFGARVTLRPLPFIGVAVGFSRLNAVSDLDGTTCDVYWPENSNCVEESLDNRISLRTVGYEIFVPVRLMGFELSAAAGVDVTTFERAELIGKQTGRVLVPYTPDNGLLGSIFDFNGSHLRFGVGIYPLLGLPVTARVAYQRRNTDLDACVTDSYAPFCSAMHSNELLLGLAIGAR